MLCGAETFPTPGTLLILFTSSLLTSLSISISKRLIRSSKLLTMSTYSFKAYMSAHSSPMAPFIMNECVNVFMNGGENYIRTLLIAHIKSSEDTSTYHVSRAPRNLRNVKFSRPPLCLWKIQLKLRPHFLRRPILFH